jgi:hypothetical protein
VLQRVIMEDSVERAATFAEEEVRSKGREAA